jgi:uridine kinase
MPKIVLVGGGSSSGKTFITNRALKSLRNPDDFIHLSFDDYYKDISFMSMEERKQQNFDIPDAFDWPLLMRQIQDLKNGKVIQKPVYDFNLFTRSDKVEEVKPAKVMIFEGIMALQNEEIRKMADLKIYIDASPERRFLRRLIRDHTERDNRPYEQIISQYFNSVKPCFDTYVEPTKVFADAILYNEGTAESESKASNILATLLESLESQA